MKKYYYFDKNNMDGIKFTIKKNLKKERENVD